MSRFKKILKWFHNISIVLVFLLLIVSMVYSYAMTRKVKHLSAEINSEITSLKAQGKPVCTLDLAGKVPDSENAAVIYEKAFEVISTSAADKDVDGIKRILGRKPIDSPELLAQARKTVGRYNKALVIADKASSRNKCRYHTNWEDGPLGVKFTYYADARRLASLATADAVLHAKDGRMSEAMQSIELVYRLSESLKDEPTLLGQLVRTACIAYAVRGLQRSLAYGSISGDQAKHLFNLLSRIDLAPGYALAADGERAMGLDDMALFRKSIESVNSYMIQVNACKEELWFVNEMQRNAELANLSYRTIKHRGLDADRKAPEYAILSAKICPWFPGAIKKRDTGTTVVHGDQILLALMAYKDRYGAYPASISELKSKLGWNLPTDPFSGSDFKYSRQGRGFIFYSIGDDLKDYGGKPWETFKYKHGDIVWKMDH